MGVWRRKRLNRMLLRVALALSVGCLFAPARADASCGDYVIVGSQSGHSDAPKPNEQSSQDRKQQQPCHGPSCSGVPSSLPLASAPPAPARDKEWAAVAFPTLLLEPRPLDVLAEYTDWHAVRRGNSIFHPPR
jgi:hypothetical protein